MSMTEGQARLIYLGLYSPKIAEAQTKNDYCSKSKEGHDL